MSDGGVGGQGGTINKMLESEKYLFVSSSDGKIHIYGTKDRELYEKMTCHPNNILDFDIHTSGRLLVSTGTDKKIKLWNLLDTKEIYHKNIQKQIDFVRFLPDDNLLLGLDKTLVIMNINSNELDSVIEHEGRLTDVLVSENLIISSGTNFS